MLERFFQFSRKGTTARTEVVAVDARPDGIPMPLGTVSLGGPLAPSAATLVSFRLFLANGTGNHTLWITDTGVVPTPDKHGAVLLDVRMLVRPGVPSGKPGSGNPETPANYGLLALALGAAAAFSAAGAALLLLRPARARLLEPPSYIPIDRSPPPIWPP